MVVQLHESLRRGGLLASSLIPLNNVGASSLPGIVYCGTPTGWYFTPHGWDQVAYGVGPTRSWLNNGPTATIFSLSVTQAATFSIQSGVSLSVQVDAIVASVNDTLSVSATTGWTNSNTYTAAISVTPYRYAVAQKASLYENVTGTLYYVTDTLYGCQISQSQTVSSSIPLNSGLLGESTGADPSPYPTWPQK